MRVSQRLDYALRAVTALAMLEPGETVTVAVLAEGLGLPCRFLEQQMTILGRRGIVANRRGVGGGCTLARVPEEVSVADVVRAVQGAIFDVPHTKGSAVADMWEAVADDLAERLSTVSIRDLAERQRRLDASAGSMYYI